MGPLTEFLAIMTATSAFSVGLVFASIKLASYADRQMLANRLKEIEMREALQKRLRRYQKMAHKRSLNPKPHGLEERIQEGRAHNGLGQDRPVAHLSTEFLIDSIGVQRCLARWRKGVG